MRNVFAKSPLAIAIAAALYPAAAILAADSKGDTLEEVIVTATRREINLQVVPQSVTALSTDFIQKQALTNLNDLVGALPSMNVYSAWPGQSSIIIRGIATGTSEFRIDSQVSIYLDEQPMTSITQQADVRLVDIERVELLPGPQGTLFGSSAQAGTLHYVTNSRTPAALRAASISKSAPPRAALKVTTRAAGSTFPSATTSPCGRSAFIRTKVATSTSSKGPP